MVKGFNNLNTCFSYGFNLLSLHTNVTCNWQKEGHETDCNHNYWQQYKNAGHTMCKKNWKKNVLPTNPMERQM